MESQSKLFKLGAISVYSDEFKKFIKPEPASFEIEWLEVDWLNKDDINQIKVALQEVAEVYKSALIRKYEEASDIVE